jgi:cytochrome c oxidase cbb3-type subunit 3/ubiquinol-cytochrome c reductase cytochrome c subunit
VAGSHRALILAAAALAACSRDDGNEVGPSVDARAPLRTPDGGSTAADGRIAKGAGLYAKYCAQCHGADGKGYAADNAPSLVNETFLASAKDDFIARSIALGRPGTSMAGYAEHLKGPLDGMEIAAIVAFLRSRADVAPATLVAPGPGDPARGKPIYDAQCAECHGDPSVRKQMVHLANPTFLDLAPDDLLRYAIVHGRPGTAMLPFGGTLDAQQIDDLVALLRSWAVPPGASTPPPDAAISDADVPVVINPDGAQPDFAMTADHKIPIADVKQALDDGRRLIIVDARPKSDWQRTRLPGAISIPYHQLEGLSVIPEDTWVIAYCACPDHLSGIVVKALHDKGHAKAAILKEGILEWQQRGLPVEGTGPHANPRLRQGPGPAPGHEGHGHP